MITLSSYTRLAVRTTLLAFTVVVFGAYVRLSNAGLSCPDWPGCYGLIGVPETQTAIESANQAFPDRPVDAPRAWKEMIHRYLAGFLGLAILALAVFAWRRRHRPGQLVALPVGLVGLVLFQALLGMWTVTLLLKPIVVTAHLLGGFATLALLWWLSLRQGRLFMSGTMSTWGTPDKSVTRWLVLGICLLVGQIFLGGWTSTNYAALACPDFPTCQGQWWPQLALAEALQPWHGLERNFEGGVLDNDARVTIHFLHRLGAIVVSAYFLFLVYSLVRSGSPALRMGALAIALVLIAQVSLGISNVVFFLPIEVAVAHNGVAALLLLVTMSVYHMARPPHSVAI